MSFRDNLLHLRAVNNLTQEQLAARIGVSRQAVAKWESGASTPELDKLLGMRDLFGCTLDDLVSGDLTGQEPQVPLTAKGTADIFDYDAAMRTFGWKIPTGVASIIMGLAIGCIFSGMGEAGVVFTEAVGSMIGCCFFFGGLTLGLALIIPAGMAHSAFVKAHPYLEDFYTYQQKVQARSQFTRQLVAGIACVFAALVSAPAMEVSAIEEWWIAFVSLTMIAAGVWLIIHAGMTLGRVDIAAYNEKAVKELTSAEIDGMGLSAEQRAEVLRKHESGKRIGAVCGTIMIVATIVALGLLFVPAMGSNSAEARHFVGCFWLPWPLGGLLCGVASLLMKAFGKNER